MARIIKELKPPKYTNVRVYGCKHPMCIGAYGKTEFLMLKGATKWPYCPWCGRLMESEA